MKKEKKSLKELEEEAIKRTLIWIAIITLPFFIYEKRIKEQKQKERMERIKEEKRMRRTLKIIILINLAGCATLPVRSEKNSNIVINKKNENLGNKKSIYLSKEENERKNKRNHKL